MTKERFKKLWLTACGKESAILSTESSGGMLYGKWWHIDVGGIRLTLFASGFSGEVKMVEGSVWHIDDRIIFEGLEATDLVDAWNERNANGPNKEEVIRMIESAP